MNQHKLKHLSSGISPKIQLQEKTFRYFGGTAYLGIPQNRKFLKYYTEGLKRFGVNNGTSRNNNVQLGIYDETEHFAADWVGAPAALVSSSGYLAAQLTVKYLSKGRKLAYAPSTHPSLWISDQKSNGQTFQDWSDAIVQTINASPEVNWTLVSNSMNNLFPEIYDFSFVRKINQDKHIILILDDSHGLGILNEGKGIYNSVPTVDQAEVVVVASMAKALGVDAGIVFGPKHLINNLKETSEFVGASPPSAAGLHAFINSGSIYTEALLKLIELQTLFVKSIQKKNFFFTEEFPVFRSPHPDLADRLLEKEILISSFPYPDRNGKPINRIVLSSWHSKHDLRVLVAHLNAVKL